VHSAELERMLERFVLMARCAYLVTLCAATPLPFML